MNVDILDSAAKKVGEAELASSVFEVEVKPHLLHDVVVDQLAHRRAGTHKTKGRSEVRGGGSKPWKQKGTGRARAGTIRSPLFRGGGVIFGPTPRSYGGSLNKKVKRAALKSALSVKAAEAAITIVDSFSFAAPKTKEAVTALSALGLSAKKTLVVLGSKDTNVEKSFRNIARVNLVRAEGINVYDILNAERVVVTKEALNSIQERLA